MSEDIATTLGRMMGETIAFEQDAEIFGYPERELTTAEQASYARHKRMLAAADRLEEQAQLLRDKAWEYRPKNLYVEPQAQPSKFKKIELPGGIITMWDTDIDE